jgi:glutathione peroxidase
MMAKIDVNGDNRHPLFAELCKVKDANGIEDIKWNFNKFIVRENGSVERFSHRDEPADLPF